MNTDLSTILRNSDGPVCDIAASAGVSRSTVYRRRKKLGLSRPWARIDYQRLAKIVRSANRDKRLVRERLVAAGYNLSSFQHFRRTLVIKRLIKPSDWPRVTRIDLGRDGRVLMAMVRAGASPMQVSMCFGVNMHVAKREIREAWALIDLDSNALLAARKASAA